MNQQDRHEVALAKDQDALRADTRRGLLTRADLSGLLSDASPRERGRIVKRPKLWTAMSVAGVCAVLFFVPFSYSRVAGHDLVVDVPGAGKNAVAVAKRLADVVDAQSVKVSATKEGLRAVYRVGTNSGKRAAAMARAVDAAMAKQGLTTQTSVTPVMEEVSGNVYAMTADKWFEVYVDTEGKTDDEVEQEILAQLQNGGVVDAEVEYESDDEGSTVKIAGEKDGHRFKMVRKEVGGDGGGIVNMKPVELDTDREPGMTDAELEKKILDQLSDKGLSGKVEVNGEEVKIRIEKEVEEVE